MLSSVMRQDWTGGQAVVLEEESALRVESRVKEVFELMIREERSMKC